MRVVGVAPRKTKVDSLEGVTEMFEEMRSVRASVLPSSGGMENRELGVQQVQTMCLLMPKDAVVNPGDGVCLEGETPEWRVREVQRWSGHVAVKVERIPGRGAEA